MNLNLSARASETTRESKSSRRSIQRKTLQAMTLPELMVAVGVGSMVLTIIAIIFMTSARSFAAMGHYIKMNQSSRNALDQLTREIRRAGDLTSFSTNRLVFSKYGVTNSFLVYNWDAGTKLLSKWESGDSKTNILLTECDELAFSLHRTSFAATSVISEAKGIKVAWKCSRTTMGKKVSTEDMGQALIVIRNKPI